MQILSPNWANGSQLSSNHSKWNSPYMQRNYSPSLSLFQIWIIFNRFEVIVKNLSQPMKFWPNFRCFWRFSPRDGVKRILKLSDYSNYTRIQNFWKFGENRSSSFWERTVNKKKIKKTRLKYTADAVWNQHPSGQPTWHDMTGRDTTWHDVTWHDVTQRGMTWHDQT